MHFIEEYQDFSLRLTQIYEILTVRQVVDILYQRA